MGLGASLLSKQLPALTFVVSGLSGLFFWSRHLGRLSLEEKWEVWEPSPRRRRSKRISKEKERNEKNEKNEKNVNPNTAEELMQMGVCYGDQGRMGKAMEKLVEAKAAFEDAGACETSRYAELLVQMAICYSIQGRKLEEMEKYQEAQKVYEKTGATGSREYAGLLKNMGIWLMEQNQFAQAMEKFQEAESRYIFAKAIGSSNYAGLLTSIGKCLLNSGISGSEQAMARFKEAKGIYEARWTPRLLKPWFHVDPLDPKCWLTMFSVHSPEGPGRLKTQRSIPLELGKNIAGLG